ncbi:dihydrofolate reductase family protein [Hymenobacter lapidiphilus]|uniref:Dihydrofolate reductase n=1 Tax=Hymenobacter lapidiphilus TaxID=2608003 RepID=A0A7Y7PQI3_9BACT|nr:dihydrofolate reductase family protein [Hymenobacter lapidiphilus]NVO32196.1 dihydrofolate reductase [Hymenobacter lapidiphilus]
MRKVVLYIAISLDGYIASPDGSVEWLPTADQDYGYAEFLASADATLLGRGTYEQILDSGSWPYAGLTNYVFSRQSPTQTPDASVQFVSGEALAFVRELRQQPGRTIWLIGGSTLASPLLTAGLVDELMLLVVPRVLGSGIPLWRHQAQPQTLQMLRTQTWPDGTVLLHYQLPKKG